MSSRTVAVIEWATAAVTLLWVITVFALSQFFVSLTIGVLVTSVFFGIGMIVSLGVNGLVHFRPRPLGRAEVVLVIVEAAIVLLLVVACIVDQYEYDHIVSMSLTGSLGHWFEWMLPLWLLLGPVALTVLILGLINRSRARTAPQVPTP